MLRKKPYLKSCLISVMLLACLAPSARADTPGEQLRATIDRVMEVLASIRSAEDIEGKKPLFRQILAMRFDFAEMARRSLGTYWSDLNGKEGEFVAAFTQFIESSYMGTLGSYRGEKVVYGAERVNREVAQVDTSVVGGQGAPIQVHYRLHRVDGQWKVYDVVVDHVSLVSNYQSQFSRILRTASLEELLERLREKSGRTEG